MSQNPYNNPGQGGMGAGNMNNMGGMNPGNPRMGMMNPNMNRMPGMGGQQQHGYQDQMSGYQNRPMGPGGGMGNMGPGMGNRMMGPGVRGPSPQYNMGAAGSGGPNRMMSPAGPGGSPMGPGSVRMQPPVTSMETSAPPVTSVSSAAPAPAVTTSSSGDTGNTGAAVTSTDGGQSQQEAGGAGGGVTAAGGKVTPTPGQKEVNISTVCRIGQETVEEIVSRTQEVFSILKSLHPPVGGYNKMSQMQDQSNLDKQKRLNDVLNGIGLLFKRLKVCWDKCQENTGGMDFYPIDSLIPLKDDSDYGRTELEKKRGEAYKTALDEHNELVKQITNKNRHLKDIIDQMRNIIWEINTMLAMRTN